MQAPAQFARRPHGSSGSRSPGEDTLELVQDVLASSRQHASDQLGVMPAPGHQLTSGPPASCRWG